MPGFEDSEINTIEENLPSIEFGSDYEIAKAHEKTFKAKMAELDYLKRKGELVERVDVEREVFDMARKVRNNILNIPAKIMDKLAATTDPFEVEKLLTDELYQALEGLANEVQE